MSYQSFQTTNSEGLNLFTQVWEPQYKPWAVICLVHGIGEHSSRYNHWAERFIEEGIAVLSFDQRGHGLSDGKKGVVASYMALLDDIDLMLGETGRLFPDVPQILYGHSLGGGEVLNHVLRRNSAYKGVISTSPWLISQASPGQFLVGIARGLARIIPDLALPTHLDTGLLSHDQEVVNAYRNDSLVHSLVSIRLFVEAYDAGYWALNHSVDLDLPVLVMHGDEDRITSSDASRRFAFYGKGFCQLEIFEGAYHELHNELMKDKVFDVQLEWIKKLLGKSE
jgi:alpha-beta hydrolase superfamily lysophospholipase